VRRWLRLGPIALITVVALCEVQPGAEAAQSPAQRTAAQLLQEVPLPPGSRAVSHLTSALLAHPASSIGCTPLVDEARLIVVHDRLQSVSTFLTRHHPTRWTVQGSGGSVDRTTGDASRNVIYVPVATAAAPQPELVVTYAAEGKKRVGIRVDAEVVPTGAQCSSNGAAPAATEAQR
jgi:hypothetical protein